MKKNLIFCLFSLLFLTSTTHHIKAFNPNIMAALNAAQNAVDGSSSLVAGALGGIASIGWIAIAEKYKLLDITDGGTAVLLSGLALPFAVNALGRHITNDPKAKRTSSLAAMTTFTLGAAAMEAYLYPLDKGAFFAAGFLPALCTVGTGLYYLAM